MEKNQIDKFKKDFIKEVSIATRIPIKMLKNKPETKTLFSIWLKNKSLLLYKNTFGFRRFFILDYWRLKLS